MARFTMWMAGFSIFVVIILWLIVQKWPAAEIPKFWVLVAGIAVLSYLAGIASVAADSLPGSSSAFIMLGSLVFKMLAAMGLAAWYVVSVKNAGVPFGLEYFTLYIVFTAFEMYAMLSNLRHQNNKRKTPINER